MIARGEDHAGPAQQAEDGERMALSARDVGIRFGGVVAIQAMALDVRPGEIVGLIGPNGAGKTTFINCLTGVYRAQSGTIRWYDRSILGLAPSALLRLGVARTFQNVALLHGLTVMDLVRLGAALGRRNGAAGCDAAGLTERLLRPLDLERHADQPIQTLSYGQRKAVDLARALAADPRLLLLDEPVAGLTLQEAYRMADVIGIVRDRLGCAILMVEHKMDVVMRICDRVVVMAAGSKIFEGSGAAAQSDPDVRRVYLGEP
jgi:branched-chain amino acid transport system ATP-binding protein